MHVDDLVFFVRPAEGHTPFSQPVINKNNSKNSMIMKMDKQFPSFMLNNETLLETEFVKCLGHLISNSTLDNRVIVICSMEHSPRKMLYMFRQCKENIVVTYVSRIWK